MEKMKMETVNIVSQNVQKLGELFPACLVESLDANGRLRCSIDFEKLRELLGQDVAQGHEAYKFTWVGKRASLAEANEPIRKTLRPCVEESKNWDETGNLYIEGDNLDVLKLLQESYLGKVKMIYIDPPYNTGSDAFVYPDNYMMDKGEYNEGAQIYDEDGNMLLKENQATNPRFHSDWCSMIYSRLTLARNLLSDDGVIFLSIDDNEIDNLIKICNEIFNHENLLANLIWDLKTGTSAGHFTRGHEYLLCYAKDKTLLPNFKNFNDGERIIDRAVKKISYKNPAVEITFPAGFKFEGEDAIFSGEVGDSEKEYIVSGTMEFKHGKLVAPTTLRAGFAMRNQIEDFIRGKEVYDTKGQRVLRIFFNQRGILSYEKEKTTINPRSVLSGIANTKNGTDELINLFGSKLFNFPKPSALIKYLIQVVTEQDSLILDFFSGSATTAHAVMQLNAEDGGNRKYIMVQIPELCDEKSEAYKSGYKNICEIGKERIRRAGEKIKSENPLTSGDLDVGFRVFKVSDSNMTDAYYGAGAGTQSLLSDMISNIKPDRTAADLFFQCLLDFGVPLDVPYHKETIRDAEVWVCCDGELMACFDENVSEEAIAEIATRKPTRVVFLDKCFKRSADRTNVDVIFARFSPETTVRAL